MEEIDIWIYLGFGIIILTFSVKQTYGAIKQVGRAIKNLFTK